MIELLRLFIIFLYIGLFTFGGGYAMIPLMEDVLVSKGFLTTSQLFDFIAISESTPGAFAINVASFVGYNSKGIIGSIFASIGLIVPSIIIITLIAKLASKLTNNKIIKSAFYGIRPCVIGILLAVIVSLSKTILFPSKVLNINLLFIVLIILSLKLKYRKLNPIFLILFSALLGIMLL